PLERNEKLQKYIDELMPIGHQQSNLPNALACTANNLIRTSCELGNLLAITN
ncbi:MAG: glycerate kinase, partial [Segetibacter sp.]|nr:glycerate kinase [Segetibacter sp.]